jgi:hypothetical protein
MEPRITHHFGIITQHLASAEMALPLNQEQERAIRSSGEAAQRRRNVFQNPLTYQEAGGGSEASGAAHEEVESALKSGEAAQKKRNAASKPVTQNPPDNAPNSDDLSG